MRVKFLIVTTIVNRDVAQSSLDAGSYDYDRVLQHAALNSLLCSNKNEFLQQQKCPD